MPTGRMMCRIGRFPWNPAERRAELTFEKAKFEYLKNPSSEKFTIALTTMPSFQYCGRAANWRARKKSTVELVMRIRTNHGPDQP
jgi:hypothetical protein